MKKNRLILILLFGLTALLLSACTGAGQTNSWAGVTAADEYVYYANGNLVYALDSKSGNTAWEYPQKASAQRLFYAEPALAGEQLIVVDYAHGMTSLNAKTGAETWSFEDAKGRYIDSPLILNDLIIAPNTDGSMYAVNLSGNSVWTFKTGQALWARPVSDGKTIFFTSMDKNFYAVDAASGELRWKTDLKISAVARALLENDTLYVGNLDGALFAINAADGSILWEQKVGGGIWAAPLLHEGKLYVGDQSGRINILDSADGKVLQYIETESSILGAGVLLENGVAFGNEAGELIVIGFNGERLWTRTFDGNLYSNIQKNGENLLLTLTQGEKPLIAVDLNGNEIWNFSVKSDKK